MKLSQKSRYESAFATTFGKYKFLRVAFGLAQGLACFTAVVQKVFCQFNDLCFFIWIMYWYTTLVKMTT